MISKIVLSNGEEFTNVSDIYEIIDNNLLSATPSSSIVNIMLKNSNESVIVDINAINVSFSTFSNEIKVYMKDTETSAEYLGATLTGYVNVRSVSKSYSSNLVTVSLSK